MTSHRKPPLRAPEHLVCRWCGEAIKPLLKKNGQPRKVQASMHRDCAEYYRGLTNTAHLRLLLIKRDGKRCRECKADHLTIDLDVDHVVPLWKVAHLTDEQRRPYFLLENLQLICFDPCHKAKSKREAAERAHYKRLVKPKVRRGRKIPSRPFEKRPKKADAIERGTALILETRHGILG